MFKRNPSPLFRNSPVGVLTSDAHLVSIDSTTYHNLVGGGEGLTFDGVKYFINGVTWCGYSPGDPPLTVEDAYDTARKKHLELEREIMAQGAIPLCGPCQRCIEQKKKG